MINKIKSQVSMEFILTTGIVLFLFLMILIISGMKNIEIRKYSETQDMKIPCYEISNIISDVYNAGDNTKATAKVEYYNITFLGNNREAVIWTDKKNKGYNESYICRLIPINLTNTYNSSFTIPADTEFIIENKNNVIEIRPSWMDEDLVLWYTMEDQNSTHILDRSGYNNDGELINSPDCSVNGYRGLACDFGNDNYIKTSYTPPPNFNMTILLMYKANIGSGPAYTNNQYHYLIRSGDTQAKSIQILLRDYYNDIISYVYNNTYPTGDFIGGEWNNYNFEPNKWYFFASDLSTFSGVVKVYHNSTLKGTGTRSSIIFSGTDTLSIGHSINSCNGTIDDVRIYNRSLSASEISYLYQYYNNYITENGAKFLE